MREKGQWATILCFSPISWVDSQVPTGKLQRIIFGETWHVETGVYLSAGKSRGAGGAWGGLVMWRFGSWGWKRWLRVWGRVNRAAAQEACAGQEGRGELRGPFGCPRAQCRDSFGRRRRLGPRRGQCRERRKTEVWSSKPGQGCASLFKLFHFLKITVYLLCRSL